MKVMILAKLAADMHLFGISHCSNHNISLSRRTQSTLPLGKAQRTNYQSIEQDSVAENLPSLRTMSNRVRLTVRLNTTPRCSVKANVTPSKSSMPDQAIAKSRTRTAQSPHYQRQSECTYNCLCNRWRISQTRM